MYWNPAGAEECSSHFITTIIPPATTTTVTVTSGIGDITTITGPVITASTITPSEIIPTYIVRACYGDVSYRFESACSCIGAGPTTATVPAPVATNTVVVPSLSVPSISASPLITPLPIDGGGKLPEPIIVGPGLDPACLAVGAGSVVVTVQVEEFFAMSLTVSGPAFCIGDPTMPPLPPLPSSQCNCASTLPSAPFSSSSTLLAISNETSSSYTDSFSTVFRTSYTATSTGSFSNYSISRSRRATSETTLTTAEPTTSESPETSEFESSTSSRSFQPFETRNFSSTAEPSLEPSSTAEPTLAPSSTVASSSSDSSISASSSAESSGPTSFVPVGPQIYIKITGGTYAGSYLETDEPDATVTSNFKSHVTADLDSAAVWTLDRETGILFQQVDDGTWWGAYFTFGVRSSFSSVMLLPADDVIGWLTTPVVQREPLRCKIDYASDFLLTCGTHGWTTLMESDKCGWTVTVPLNPLLDRGCPGSQEMILQAVVIYPTEEGISK